ncbi:hypothetical protein C8J28_1467 [Cereibacter azotoformans]|uniref:Uncharacterized protein n=1 Tax=Cereibacter azotoformans TaxID=43057 RepID=A0A2T5JK98_9RHOB|nr:hypothetical protein C8J28_1467 [Cereibacter azotoformans]
MANHHFAQRESPLYTERITTLHSDHLSNLLIYPIKTGVSEPLTLYLTHFNTLGEPNGTKGPGKGASEFDRLAQLWTFGLPGDRRLVPAGETLQCAGNIRLLPDAFQDAMP